MNTNDRLPISQPADHSREWWLSAWIGYPLAAVLITLAFLIPMIERSLGVQDLFLEPPFVLAMLAVAWFWGLGPALLALVLQVLALDYWLIPPFGSISFFQWPDIASFVPFILIQLLVLRLVMSQKKARQQLSLAHQAAQDAAEASAASNQALGEVNAQLEHMNQVLAESNRQLDQANHVKDQFLCRILPGARDHLFSYVICRCRAR